MSLLANRQIICPYCGETIEIIIDCSVPEQKYIEDCEICCRPVHLTISVNSLGNINIIATHENE